MIEGTSGNLRTLMLVNIIVFASVSVYAYVVPYYILNMNSLPFATMKNVLTCKFTQILLRIRVSFMQKSTNI